MRVVIAPDAFKGSATAAAAAAAIRSGWLSVRPGDDVVTVPLADGGEGTMSVVEAATPGALRQPVRVLGPQGPLVAEWLLCPDGTAVVELAEASGLPLHERPDPLGAHTFGFGQLLAAAAGHRKVTRIVAAVGGSASTDGGTGALAALGVRFLGPSYVRLPLGGVHLADLARVDVKRRAAAPPGGVEVLVDVDAPLLGPAGAAAQFGPQKGASEADVTTLDGALARLAEIAGGHPWEAGAGAAGGTAYGLATLWGAGLVSGSAAVARLTGLDASVDGADLVITGEGRMDAQSFRGKVVGQVVGVAAGHNVPVWACVGQQSIDATALAGSVTLTGLAGSPGAAMADPLTWLRAAGADLARRAATPATPIPAGADTSG